MSNRDARHRHVQDLLGPYVIGALSPEEEAEVREHLDLCETCRSEERDLREAHEYLAELAATVEQPPPDIKGRVFEELPRRRTRYAPLLAAAAAVVAFVALGLFASSGLPGFLSTGTAIALEGTKMAPKAHGKLSLEPDATNTHAELEVKNMPRTKDGEYYELWFGKEGGRISAGTFTVGKDGSEKCAMNVPAEAAGGYERVGITLERFPEEPRMQDARVVLGGELSDS